MSGIVFINYRRDDTKHAAGRLRDHLAAEFTRERVFMDVDNIPLGVDFVEYLGGQVGRCQIMVSLIGPGWLEMLRRKAGDANDFVRIEIEAALERNIRVIPVLVDGTAMPRADDLPESVRSLVQRNAAQLRRESFGADAGKLARVLRETLDGAAPGVASAPAATASGDPVSRVRPGSGESFRDAPFTPEMVVIPAGEFWMGSPDGELDQFDDEAPRHKVTISKPFAIGSFAVTFAEWDAAVADGGCGGYNPDDEGWGRGGRPVINVNSEDAQAYVQWLREKTGKDYRLPSEAEWEYAARAGTVTPFWWGKSITTEQANYDGNDTYAGGGKGEYREITVPVKSFQANPWGLYQVHGNVWEWCEDVWHSNYGGAPADGSARLDGRDSIHRVLRGGSWSNDPGILRAAVRSRYQPVIRRSHAGFRVARTLNP